VITEGREMICISPKLLRKRRGRGKKRRRKIDVYFSFAAQKLIDVVKQDGRVSLSPSN